MEVDQLPIALALAIINADRKNTACEHCAELQEALTRLQSELNFLKKKKDPGIASLVASLNLSEDQIRQTEVWQFFTKGLMQRKLESRSLGLQKDSGKELDFVVSQCESHISKIKSRHWQPDALFDLCIHFLISASQPNVFAPQKNTLESTTKSIVGMLLQEIISFSFDVEKNPLQRDHASKAVVDLAKCNGTENLVIEVIFGKILDYIKEANATRQVPSYQTLENLFFFCWILEKVVVRISAENTKAWPNVLSTIELLSQNTNQATHLPPLLERYIYKIVLNLPNQESQLYKLHQAQLGHVLSKLETQLQISNKIK